MCESYNTICPALEALCWQALSQEALEEAWGSETSESKLFCKAPSHILITGKLSVQESPQAASLGV